MNSNNKKPVISLIGPTAVGKTDLAISLYHKLPDYIGRNIDIISVDSAMVYKGLDIGTGKPEQSILDAIPHGLVNIREPYEVYSVADFCADVHELIVKSHDNNRMPLLVGGTMMYFKAIYGGLDQLPSSNSKIRQELNNRVQSQGLSVLYAELLNIDSAYAKSINSNDTQRILRALEVYLLSGKTLTELINNKTHNKDSRDMSNYNNINIIFALNDREVVHSRIAKRFHAMLAAGFIEEVRALYNNKLIHSDLPAIKSCGYRQVWQYLDNLLSYDDMIAKSLTVTRQLAKRQYTWLRSFVRDGLGLAKINRVAADNNNYEEEIIKIILNNLNQSE